MVGNVMTPTHLLFVLVVALLVLGPKRLPAAGRGLGEAMRGFKDGLTPGNGADTTGDQVSDDQRIMQAIEVAAAGTTSHATSAATASFWNDRAPSEAATESASWQSPAAGSTANPSPTADIAHGGLRPQGEAGAEPDADRCLRED